MDSILNCCICFVIVKYQKPRTNIGQCLKVWRPSPDSRLSAAVILRLLIFSFVPSWTRQTCVHGKLFWSVNKVCWVIPRWWWSLQSTETVSSVIWHHRCLVPQWNTIWHRRCTLAGNWVNARGKPMAFTNKIIRQFKNAWNKWIEVNNHNWHTSTFIWTFLLEFHGKLERHDLSKLM